VLLVGCLVVAVAAGASAGPEINQYPVATPNANLTDITVGPDGDLWFTEAGSNMIGRMTTGGSIVAEYAVPPIAGQIATSNPGSITSGSDGRLWFTTNGYANSIDAVTVGGSFSRYPVPTPNALLGGITAGPDGNVWFTEEHAVGRVTPGGSFAEYPVAGDVAGIAAGPDGNLWAGEVVPNQILRITTTGQITGFPLPGKRSGSPAAVVGGPDPGGVWFLTGAPSSGIGRIATSAPNAVKFYKLKRSSDPDGLASGPGASQLWFVEGAGYVGRVLLGGKKPMISAYKIPGQYPYPLGVAVGEDGNVWFTDQDNSDIDQLVVPAS
jgi:virginiamycin B lyase